MPVPVTATSREPATDGEGHERPDRERDRALRPPSGLRLVDDVVESLEEAMLAGELRPGERLIETRLCDELRVSRTTLREALLTLQNRGLVRSEPRRGTFVNRLSIEESLDLCRARAMLESYAVSTGLDRLTSDDFRVMHGLVDQLADCAFPGDIAQLIRLDLAFHTIIMEAADSPVLHELWSSLNGRMSALILSSIDRLRSSAIDLSDFHRHLITALESGDVRIATEAVIVHYVRNDAINRSSLAGLTRTLGDLAVRPSG